MNKRIKSTLFAVSSNRVLKKEINERRELFRLEVGTKGESGLKEFLKPDKLSRITALENNDNFSPWKKGNSGRR